MKRPRTTALGLPRFALWKKMAAAGAPVSFELEITARCNHNCRHCYINRPADDDRARAKELSLEAIKSIADEAVSLGALWCLITGGEPLLREDFFDIYLYLKRKGLLVSVFTNATLITPAHGELFRKYPPRAVEVTVYGVTDSTYERVTRTPGAFSALLKGLDILGRSGTPLRLKTVAMRSNLDEFDRIRAFCRKRSGDGFRFDPFLNLRLDADPARNREIMAERLSPREIVALEQSDPLRLGALLKTCQRTAVAGSAGPGDTRLFPCAIGSGGFYVGHDGLFRLCGMLNHPDCVYDLTRGNLTRAWGKMVPAIRSMRSKNAAFLSSCRICPFIDLCMWCPAHAYLETGALDRPVSYFCAVAHARAGMLNRCGPIPRPLPGAR